MDKQIINQNNKMIYCVQCNNNKSNTETISNYSINGLFILQELTITSNSFNKKEKLVIHIKKNNEEIYLKIINGEDESDYKSFFKTIHKDIVGLYENFNKKKYHILIQQLYEDLKTVVIYKNWGYQLKKNIYVVSNKLINLCNREIEDYPKFPCELNLTDYEKLQILPSLSCQPALYIFKDYRKILKEFSYIIIKTFNKPEIIIAIGIVIGTCFFDLFITEAQGFPYVVFYGDSNSGKTTILRILSSIFGINNFTQLTSGTSTIVNLRMQLSKYNNIPIFIEELDVKHMQNIEDLGKDCFSGTPRKKSSKDNIEITTEINTSFCATTNNFFENMTLANFSRCIPVNFKLGDCNLTDFKYHSKAELKKLSCFLPEILYYREKILNIYNEQFRIAQKYCNFSRISNNIAISMTIWTVINDILNEQIVNTEQLAINYLQYFEQYINTEILYGDIFLADVYSLFNKSELIWNRDFIITKNKYLRINISKYCEIYNSVNENKKLNSAQLKLKLCNDKRFIDLKGTDLKPIGRAIKVDISENETLLDIQNRVTNKFEKKE